MHSLTESYRRATIAEFAGLEKPKRILSKLLAAPFESAWLFIRPSGTGKTSMTLALADAIPARRQHMQVDEIEQRQQKILSEINNGPHLSASDEAALGYSFWAAEIALQVTQIAGEMRAIKLLLHDAAQEAQG